MKEKKNSCVCPIGGQALIEGVMMQSRTTRAMAVRNPEGYIEVQTRRIKGNGWWRKVPLLRGVVSFVQSLVSGTKSIYESSAVAFREEETPGSFWMGVSTLLGVLLAVGLFFILPTLALNGLEWLFHFQTDKYLVALIEGCIRILIFIFYLFLVSRMKDIKRTFMYHGAEHRTINCYEKGMELTVENVQKCSTRHNRCGTTFLFLVMVVSILVFALATYIFSVCGLSWWVTDKWMRIVVRLVLLPFVAGFSFEILQGLAKLPDNWFVAIFRAPGLALQRLTTYPPEDDMAEVAIASFMAVMNADADPDAPERHFGEYETGKVRTLLQNMLSTTDAQACEADWILCEATGKKRAQLALVEKLTKQEYTRAVEIVEGRRQGKALDLILGRSEFYGVTVEVSEDVLIPRLDTEILVDEACKIAKNGYRVLDLMTGSGCIGKAIASKFDVDLTISDLSEKALEVAKRNNPDAQAVLSDCFDNIEGKFDLIVSNPPYIKTDVIATLSPEVQAQPRMALDGGADGLDAYRKIALSVKDHLTENGVLLLEIGYDQGESVSALFADVFDYVQVKQDLEGNDRVVIATDNKERV